MTVFDFIILMAITLVIYILFDAWMQQFKKKRKVIPKSQRAIYFELMEELGYHHYDIIDSLKEIKTYDEIVRVNREMRRGLENYKIKNNVNNSPSRR